MTPIEELTAREQAESKKAAQAAADAKAAQEAKFAAVFSASNQVSPAPDVVVATSAVPTKVSAIGRIKAELQAVEREIAGIADEVGV